MNRIEEMLGKIVLVIIFVSMLGPAAFVLGFTHSHDLPEKEAAVVMAAFRARSEIGQNMPLLNLRRFDAYLVDAPSGNRTVPAALIDGDVWLLNRLVK